MSEPSAPERLFFALWPAAEQQQAWAGAACKWLPPGSGRLIVADNLHLTLLFAGEVTAEQRRCLEQMADAIRIPSFSLRFDRAGYWHRPEVAWFGCSQMPAPLLDLARALNRGGKSCGIAVDDRPYAAHLTVARKVRRAPPPAKPEVAEWPVDRFVLVRSRLTPKGSLYEVVRSWSLALPGGPDLAAQQPSM